MGEVNVYIASPLIFSPATMGWYETVMIPAIEKYINVVNKPGEFSEMKKCVSPDEKSKAIFDHNVNKLNKCDLVICVLDGAQTDDGTAWEVGYAWAHGKPAIGVRFDSREGCHERFSKFTNLMIENCCIDILTNLADLEKFLQDYVDSLEK